MPVCCSEHDVSRCFSAHGGTLLMSWRSWPEPPLLGVSKKKVFYVWNLALAAVELMSPGDGRRGPPSLGTINHSAWKPKAGGRDPDPGEETQTQGQEPRTWRQESRSRKLENRTSARSLRPDFSLRFLRLSGSTKCVEECMGQDPGIIRGRGPGLVKAVMDLQEDLRVGFLAAFSILDAP
ncbi:hypothetical protein F2Q70_00036150 [Brassica cretica]|uniref:Uncharacterized protein n=1 Tax=Brassica cretica TaxID=69181 RepID=A0A8S9JRY9_BRACR|nr:hypothetical protein F2Q70_00036150 [Brassica cretica]